jgi:hypothetical protein
MEFWRVAPAVEGGGKLGGGAVMGGAAEAAALRGGDRKSVV